MTLSKWLYLITALISLPACSPDFPVAEGYVLEAVTNRPLAGAYVKLAWSARTKYAAGLQAEVVVKTDANGWFSHRAPKKGGYGWENGINAYLPGYGRYPWGVLNRQELIRSVEDHDEQGRRLSAEEMLALGYEMDQSTRSLSGWFMRKPRPAWYRREKHKIIYLEKSTATVSERLQDIAWQGRANWIVNQRLGPLMEFDRVRVEEAVGLLCGSKEKLTKDAIWGFNTTLGDWRSRYAQAGRKFNEKLDEDDKKKIESFEALYHSSTQRVPSLTPEQYAFKCEWARNDLELNPIP